MANYCTYEQFCHEFLSNDMSLSVTESELIWDVYQAFRAIDTIAKTERWLRSSSYRVKTTLHWENKYIAKIRQYMENKMYK